jgi:hypothetical protein
MHGEVRVLSRTRKTMKNMKKINLVPGRDTNLSDFQKRFKGLETHPSELPAKLPAARVGLERTFFLERSG